MTTATAIGVHPLLDAAEVIDRALTEISDLNPTFMATPDKAEALLAFGALESRISEVRLRLLADAGDVAEDTASRDAAGWLARQARRRTESTRADVRLAEALDRRYLRLGAALRDGTANREQVDVIVRALDKLPADVGQEILQLAEQLLVDECATLTPAELAKAGKHILEHVAPEVAEEALRKQLADEEKSARQKQRLHLKRMGDGTTRIGGLLPDATATRLAQALQAFANPRRHPNGDSHDPSHDAAVEAFLKLPYPRRLAEAFGGLMEALDPSRLPIHGGDATTLVVTIGLKDLQGSLAESALGALVAGDLPGDDSSVSTDHISAAEARRLACTSKIIPAVLGGDSEILDLGQGQRLFSPAQRRALLLRDRECRAEGCDIPGTWAEAHHWLPWSRGGPTDVANGVLLCRFHHMRAHDPAYDTSLLPNGDVRYSRRR